MKKSAAMGLLGLVAIVNGCNNSHVTRDYEIGQAEVLAVDSLMRGIVVQDRRFLSPGWNPHGGARQIICAEPPPDAASAFASSFGSTFGANLSKVSPEVALSFSNSVGQAVGQLVRSNPVNVLRDGLYRTCEAYANGAISDMEYRILLSGLDDTIVAMTLANEISRFAPIGPVLQASGTATGGQTTGGAALGEELLTTLQGQLETANTRLAERSEIVTQLESRERDVEPGSADALQLQTDLVAARTERAAAQQHVQQLETIIENARQQQTSATTTTSGTPGVSQIPLGGAAAIAIAAIHDGFARAPSASFVFIECLNALDRAVVVPSNVSLSAPEQVRYRESALVAECREIIDPEFMVQAMSSQTGGTLSPLLWSQSIADLQRFLQSQGHNPGRIDGQLGPLTLQALQAYVQSLPES